MIETKTKEINGKSFQVTPFMAVEALKLKAHLIKILGPAIGELVNVTGNKGLETEINGEVLTKAIEKITETLDEDNFINLINRLFKNVICNYKDEKGENKAVAFASNFEVAMNCVFQGEVFGIYPLIKFVLEVNYPDFFSKVLPSIGTKM